MYTCMLNHRGGTEGDLTVSRLAPGPQASPLAPAFEGERGPEPQQRPDGSLARRGGGQCGTGGKGFRSCSAIPPVPSVVRAWEIRGLASG